MVSFALQWESQYYVHIVPQSDIFYTGVDMLRTEIVAACQLYRNDFPIVVQCSRFMQFDATFVEMLNAVAKELANDNVVLVLQHMSLKQQQLLPVTSNIRFCNEDQELFPQESKQ